MCTFMWISYFPISFIPLKWIFYELVKAEGPPMVSDQTLKYLLAVYKEKKKQYNN